MARETSYSHPRMTSRRLQLRAVEMMRLRATTTTEENMGTSPTEALEDAPESAIVVAETTTENEGLITDEV